MSDTPNFGLLLPFDTDEPEFVRGFECGRIWTLADAGSLLGEEQIVHAANAEMMVRIGEALGYRVTADVRDEHWIAVTFEEEQT